VNLLTRTASVAATAGLLAGLALRVYGGAPVPKELERASEAQKRHYLQVQAELALHDKIRVGEQRYQQRKAFRQTLVNGMRNKVEVRRQEMLAPPATQPAVDPDTAGGSTIFFLGLLVVAAAGLAWRLLPTSVSDDTESTWAPSKPLAKSDKLPSTAKDLAEESALSEFVTLFRNGASALPGSPFANATTGGSLDQDGAAQPDPEAAFLAAAPAQIVDLRQLLHEMARARGQDAQQEMLGNFVAKIRKLKGAAGLPGLLPVWQMALALECLAKQLTGRANEVTASAVRTLTNALDLLAELCRPGLRVDLFTEPPIRLLAVDDDPISRYAMTFALKKGIGLPDLAEDGSSAMALAERHVYDAIFLDVQMPGMTGFELCSAIHDTKLNRNTPVVFVTSQSDFGARANSSLCGGIDLIGKPFLSFEITVKALTLALRGRLAKGDQAPVRLQEQAPTLPLPAASMETGLPETANPPDSVPGTAEFPDTPQPTPAHEIVKGFFDRASAHLGQLSDFVHSAAEHEANRAEILVDLYLCISALVPPAEYVQLQPAFQVTASLEAVLTKLLEAPERATNSTWQTIVTSVALLEDLCARGGEAGWNERPDIRMLVVDDDALSRRVITSALQMAFTRPDNAADGETALGLISEIPYDVIFLDVEMPGMDGFAVCEAVRKSVMNRLTPVVFVTGHTDPASRSRSIRSGGNDFIAKPIFGSELTLKAMTYAVRGRLRHTAARRNGAAAISALAAAET